MNRPDTTRTILLTPSGRGAIATIRVEGASALSDVAQHFQPARKTPLSQIPSGEIVFGRWTRSHGDHQTAEEVVVVRREEEAIEIHAHGGHCAAEAICTDLAHLGATSQTWGAWLNQQAERPISVEAQVALAQCSTNQVTGILLDQLRGALDAAIESILQTLRQNLPTQPLESTSNQVAELLDPLCERAELGLRLTSGWKVVLAGRPNVGKSSLLNALVGYQRSLVFDFPGTTRDVLTATTAVEGWPVELIDVAGLRQTEHPLEAAGVLRAKKLLTSADLVLLVTDGSLPWTEGDQEILASRPDALVVHQKSDLPQHQGTRPDGLAVSALQGEGIEALLRQVAERLIPSPPLPGEAIPFTDRQAKLIRSARAACATMRPAEAERHLISCVQGELAAVAQSD